MIDTELIRSVDRSWLYHLKEALASQDPPINYIYQSRQERFQDGEDFDLSKDFVIVSPMNQWTREGADTLIANFRVGVVTNQREGDVLVAHNRAFEIMNVVEQALFGPDRLLDGFSMDDSVLYSIPLRTFDDDGNPLEQVDQFGLKYERGLWEDRSREFENTRLWAVEIVVRYEQ